MISKICGCFRNNYGIDILYIYYIYIRPHNSCFPVNHIAVRRCVGTDLHPLLVLLRFAGFDDDVLQ